MNATIEKPALDALRGALENLGNCAVGSVYVDRQESEVTVYYRKYTVEARLVSTDSNTAVTFTTYKSGRESAEAVSVESFPVTTETLSEVVSEGAACYAV